MLNKLWIVTVSACVLTLAGCSNPAQPAPSREAPVTQGRESSKTPVTEQSDGTAANTGNLVNGPQPASKSKK